MRRAKPGERSSQAPGQHLPLRPINVLGQGEMPCMARGQSQSRRPVWRNSVAGRSLSASVDNPCLPCSPSSLSQCQGGAMTERVTNALLLFGTVGMGFGGRPWVAFAVAVAFIIVLAIVEHLEISERYRG